MNQRVKTIVAWSEGSFDTKINEFLDNPKYEVVEIKFTTPILMYCAMIVYRSKTEFGDGAVKPNLTKSE